MFKSNNLMVTAGASHGLHLVSTLLFGNNVPIFVEDPTYFIAIKMLTDDLGCDVISGKIYCLAQTLNL